MSDLVLRKLPFNFDGFDFMWNQGNSPFTLMMNSVSFQVIGFERYMCRAMRDAEKVFTDPAVLNEARMFKAQEMIHSQAHLKHCKALIAQHPGLQEVLDESVADYEALYHREDLDFHLAYAANIIHIGAIDLFLEESLDYARRLRRAGVGVELDVWPGAFHAFQSTDCHISREARRVARTAIKRALHGDAK